MAYDVKSITELAEMRRWKGNPAHNSHTLSSFLCTACSRPASRCRHAQGGCRLSARRRPRL